MCASTYRLEVEAPGVKAWGYWVCVCLVPIGAAPFVQLLTPERSSLCVSSSRRVSSPCQGEFGGVRWLPLTWKSHVVLLWPCLANGSMPQ